MNEFTAVSGSHQATIQPGTDGKITIDGREILASLRHGSGTSTLRIGPKQYNVYIQKIHELSYEIWIRHNVIPVTLETPLSRLLDKFGKAHASKASDYLIRAPMPGLIKEILVAPGDVVQPGSAMIILEAMKMENEIRSVVAGTVKSVEVKQKDAVEKNQLLIDIESLPHE
jgi:acetyl/propionyl-CoA carboxylase alpha subunit